MDKSYIKFLCTLWFLKECEYKFEDSFNDVIRYAYENFGFTEEQIVDLENLIYCYNCSTKLHILEDLINYVIERF